MRYIIDHDFHIHSNLSPCSGDPMQTPDNILRYGEENGLTTLCITDHFWDEFVPGPSKDYAPLGYATISKALPLPQGKNTKFLFGCETDLREDLTLGISKERMELMDFIVIPTTHMHMEGFTVRNGITVEEKSVAYIKRLHAVLDMDLPFHKVGIAHLASTCVADPGDLEQVLNGISDEDYRACFKKAVEKGVGIEINRDDFLVAQRSEELNKAILRPFKIAKEEGCKFYLGSDGHRPASLNTAIGAFNYAIDALGLTEDDKFHL